MTLDNAIPLLAGHLRNKAVDSFRLGACKLMHSIIKEIDIDVCPSARYLLPIAMSLTTDPVVECGKLPGKCGDRLAAKEEREKATVSRMNENDLGEGEKQRMHTSW